MAKQAMAKPGASATFTVTDALRIQFNMFVSKPWWLIQGAAFQTVLNAANFSPACLLNPTQALPPHERSQPVIGLFGANLELDVLARKR
jgi:hypothetical protein